MKSRHQEKITKDQPKKYVPLKVETMRKLLLFCWIPFLLLQVSCGSSSGKTANVVKPKYHHWRYEKKNDKRVKRRAAREVVNNVSGWIVDLQERKRTEARVAIEQLFGGPRTSES